MSDGGDIQRVNLQTGQPQFQPFRPGSVQPVQQPMDFPAPGTPEYNTSPPLSRNELLNPVVPQPPVRPVQPDLETHTARPQLADNEVLLTDGRVVAVKETTPPHDFMVRKVLKGAGVTLDGLAALDYLSYMALCAVESVGRLNRETGEVEGREEVDVPITKLMLEERAMLPKTTKNLNRIVAKYNEINGVGSDENDPLA